MDDFSGKFCRLNSDFEWEPRHSLPSVLRERVPKNHDKTMPFEVKPDCLPDLYRWLTSGDAVNMRSGGEIKHLVVAKALLAHFVESHNSKREHKMIKKHGAALLQFVNEDCLLKVTPEDVDKLLSLMNKWLTRLYDVKSDELDGVLKISLPHLKIRKAAWKNARQLNIVGIDSSIADDVLRCFRVDALGLVVCPLAEVDSMAALEFDHWFSRESGGRTAVENITVLQMRANRSRKGVIVPQLMPKYLQTQCRDAGISETSFLGQLKIKMVDWVSLLGFHPLQLHNECPAHQRDVLWTSALKYYLPILLSLRRLAAYTSHCDLEAHNRFHSLSDKMPLAPLAAKKRETIIDYVQRWAAETKLTQSEARQHAKVVIRGGLQGCLLDYTVHRVLLGHLQFDAVPQLAERQQLLLETEVLSLLDQLAKVSPKERAAFLVSLQQYDLRKPLVPPRSK